MGVAAADENDVPGQGYLWVHDAILAWRYRLAIRVAIAMPVAHPEIFGLTTRPASHTYALALAE
jgi:hypothetical protein